MSFRIDDILKKDTNQLVSEKIYKCENHRCEKKNDWHEGILEKSGFNRQSFQYYRSISEPQAGSSVWCQNERIYQNQEHYDMYRTKAISYPNIYQRSPIWPNYPSFPLTFFPQLCHFSKRKGGQVRFTANQTDALEKRFISHKYLSPEDRKLLADSLKLTDRQVKTWFQNRRAKWRRCNSVSSAEISSTKFQESKGNGMCRKDDVFLKSHN